MKKVVSACIDRILEFDSQEEAVDYLEGLRKKKANFQVMSRNAEGGKYRVRVREQYNKSPLLTD